MNSQGQARERGTRHCQGAPRDRRSGRGQQDAAAGDGQQNPEGRVRVEVSAVSAAAVEQADGDQVAGGGAYQGEHGQSGRHARVVTGEAQAAADADQKRQGALPGFEPGEGEAAE